MAEHNMKRADTSYFREALTGIHRDQQSLGVLIEQNGERHLNELDPVERAILYLGAFELTARIDLPYKVVINEAIELARSFGATDSYKYVNSVLDEIAREARPHERNG